MGAEEVGDLLPIGGISAKQRFHRPTDLKCDQGWSASVLKFNTTSVQPAVYTRSDLHS